VHATTARCIEQRERGGVGEVIPFQRGVPGSSKNRVMLLSNGEYNVHIIGLNWPHDAFVSKTFKVVGAESRRSRSRRRARRAVA
jgi:hypothetical protein